MLIEHNQQIGQITDSIVEEVFASYNGGVVVEQLLECLIVSRLHGNGEHTLRAILSLVGHEAQLVPVADA